MILWWWKMYKIILIFITESPNQGWIFLRSISYFKECNGTWQIECHILHSYVISFFLHYIVGTIYPCWWLFQIEEMGQIANTVSVCLTALCTAGKIHAIWWIRTILSLVHDFETMRSMTYIWSKSKKKDRQLSNYAWNRTNPILKFQNRKTHETNILISNNVTYCHWAHIT